MTPLSLMASSILWQLTYLLCSYLTPFLLRLLTPDKTLHRTLVRQAPSYLVSTIHAVLVTFRGLQHLFILRHAPACLKVAGPPSPLFLPYAPHLLVEVDRVLVTNALLAGYLLCDMVHVVRLYPSLGGVDTMLHHLAFGLCAVVAGVHTLYPFMFGWLIIGEMSTPFLNARWLMIRTGHGASAAFPWVEKAFAGVFVVTRLFVFGGGLLHQFSIFGQTPSFIPAWAKWSTMSFVCAGFLLNLVWLKKIWALATGRGKNAQAEHTKED